MHEITVKVRFGETDALGHVNNTSYFIYLEEARVSYFQSLGYKMDASEWQFILASAKCDFIDQGYFDQLLKIETYVTRIGTKSFQVAHRIKDQKTSQLIALGEAVIVYFNFEKQQSEELPLALRAKLEANLVAQ